MGRTKAPPTKNQNWVLDKALDYIPINKRRSNRRKDAICPVYNLRLANEQAEKYYLGKFIIGTTNNVLSLNSTTCAASIICNKPNPEEDSLGAALLLKFDDSSLLVKLIHEMNTIKSSILAVKQIFLYNFEVNDEDVYLKVYLKSVTLPEWTPRSGKVIKTVFNILFKVANETAEIADNPTNSTDVINQLYKNVKKYREEHHISKSGNTFRITQHSQLKPQLRPYQQEAVSWMIRKEKNIDKNQFLHPLYTKIELPSGFELYYDKYQGYFQAEAPLTETKLRGGILADEMGLGKTVEVLSCILLHSKRDRMVPKVENAVEAGVESSDDEMPLLQLARKRKLVEEPHDIKCEVEPPKQRQRKRMTDLRTNLENWYNSQLQSAIKSPRKKSIANPIQCCCGNTAETKSVSCSICGKRQHAACFGYKAEFGAYKCPQCWQKSSDLIDSGATLIVTPVALRNQWLAEIAKHVEGDFRVFNYMGNVKSLIYPTELGKFDVVITTYNVLHHELKLTGDERPSYRNTRRYTSPFCPLLLVNWWRLCLDEAQTVDSTKTLVSQMAAKITATFRWAITGTPITKQLADLYGLIDYLKIEPYNDSQTWRHVLFVPYMTGVQQPLVSFLADVLWRSSKADVVAQINIPIQTVEEHWLTYSAIEQYFYKCEHKASRNLFVEKMQAHGLSRTLVGIDRRTLKTILAPLLCLRQVCTYPNSDHKKYLVTKKSVNSMQELLEALIAKNILECEEMLRLIIASLNGLAGIHILMGNNEEAVSVYRRVLQLYSRFNDEEKNKIVIDFLQIIHAMHNLGDVLALVPNLTLKTLRDDTLKLDCQGLQQKFIQKFANRSVNALQEWNQLTATITEHENALKAPNGEWYGTLIHWIYFNSYNSELNTKIVSLHEQANIPLSNHYDNQQTLLYLITIWHEELAATRSEAMQKMNELFDHRPEAAFKITVRSELVAEVTDCHLRPDEKTKSKRKKCKMCAVARCLRKYELNLFTMGKRKESEEDLGLVGSWKPRSEELIFKAIFNVVKNKPKVENDLIEDCETFIAMFDNMKKEFKELRKFWTYLDRQIGALDELEICKIRLQLKPKTEEETVGRRKKALLRNLTYELENNLENIHLLDEHELDYQRTVLINEEKDNAAALERNIVLLSYLQTLQQQQYEGKTPDPCPICHSDLEQQWIIISCGHCYCLECIDSLVKHVSPQKNLIQCSICREFHPITNISYIKIGNKEIDANDVNLKVSVKGNYSTKIEGVISLILKLRLSEPDVKILIFSKWNTILTYLKDALLVNKVNFVSVSSPASLDQEIVKFKDETKKITALLLPVYLGSKGLNLIEATHVILVEPLLEAGEELQAVGRVHRIGQTKPTFVHKFYIKNTIEESIYKATTSNACQWENNKVTLGQLNELFDVQELETSETFQIESNISL